MSKSYCPGKESVGDRLQWFGARMRFYRLVVKCRSDLTSNTSIDASSTGWRSYGGKHALKNVFNVNFQTFRCYLPSAAIS